MKSLALFGLGLAAAALIWWLAPAGGGAGVSEGVGPGAPEARAELGARSLPGADLAGLAADGERAIETGTAPAPAPPTGAGQRESALAGRDLLRVVDTTGAPRSAVVRASWPGREGAGDGSDSAGVFSGFGSASGELRLELSELGRDLAAHPELSERLDGGLEVAMSVEGKGLVPRDFGPDELRRVPGGRLLEVERLVELSYRIDLDGGNSVLPEDVRRRWVGREAHPELSLRQAGSSFADGVPESWLPASFELIAEGYAPRIVEVPELEAAQVEPRPVDARKPGGSSSARRASGPTNHLRLDLGVLELQSLYPPLSGRLLLGSGRPLALADYTVRDAGGEEVALGRTDPDGSFRVKGLPAGRYDFELRLVVLGDLDEYLPRGVLPGPLGELRLPFEQVEIEVQPSQRALALDSWPGAYRMLARVIAPGHEPLRIGKWESVANPRFRFLAEMGMGASAHVLGESPMYQRGAGAGLDAPPPLYGSVEVDSLPLGETRSGTLLLDLAERGTVTFVAPEAAAIWRVELTAVDTGFEGAALWGDPFSRSGAKGPTVGEVVPLRSGTWRARIIDAAHPTSPLQPAVDELEFTLAPNEHLVIEVSVVSGGRVQLDVVNDFTGSSWNTFLEYELLRLEPGAEVGGEASGGAADGGGSGAASNAGQGGAASTTADADPGSPGPPWQRTHAVQWFVLKDGVRTPSALRKDRTRRFVSQALRPGTYRLVVPERLDATFEITPDALVPLRVSMD